MAADWEREHEVEWVGHPCWCRNVIERDRYLVAVERAYLLGQIDYHTLTACRRSMPR